MFQDKSSNMFVRSVKDSLRKRTKSVCSNEDVHTLTDHEEPIGFLHQRNEAQCKRRDHELEWSSGKHDKLVEKTQLNQRVPYFDGGGHNGTKRESIFPNSKDQTKVNRRSLSAIQEDVKDNAINQLENLPLIETDKTSDYDTLHRDDSSSEEDSDDDGRPMFSNTRLHSSSVPDLYALQKRDDDLRDLRPVSTFLTIKHSKNIQITPENGTATINKTTTVKDIVNRRHLDVLESVKNTESHVETELFKGGFEMLKGTKCHPIVILKGSGYGCTFAAKMLFERLVSASTDDTKAYYLKSSDEIKQIGQNEKAIILVTDANGPTGGDSGRLDGWYELLKERFPLGVSSGGNYTFIMTLQDTDSQQGKKHPLFQKYSEYILDAREKRYRPSSATTELLIEAFLRQKKIRVNPLKGPAVKDGQLNLIDKDIVDGIIPLLGSVRCVGKLAKFFRSDLSDGLNTLRKPVPQIVKRIRDSFKEGGSLFLTLLAVHAHGGQLGVGRLNQMRKMNEHTEKFWYSTDNVERMSKSDSKKNKKLFDIVELQHLYKFARENNHQRDLGNMLQKYASHLDGEFLSESNDVYRFCDGRVYYSFLLVYCEVYSEAIEHVDEHFFYNFVYSCRNTFDEDKDVCLIIDDRRPNERTRAVMNRFKKEMMLRHVAKCMQHPIMTTSFFELFLEYLGKTKHLLWTVLTQLDGDPREPYSCLYHGMAMEQDTFKGIPRNISEVILLHDIWKKKRKKPRWKTWIKSQEAESLIHAADLSNCQTFSLMVERGVEITMFAFKKAMEVGAVKVIKFIDIKGRFSPEEWHEASQYAADILSKGKQPQALLQALMSVVTKTDVNTGVTDKPPLIHYAVQTKNAILLQQLVDGDFGSRAVDVNKKYKGETPLTAATRLGIYELVNILVDKNACIRQKDVVLASSLGHDKILRLFLLQNPSFAIEEDSDGLIPLFYAVSNDQLNTVKVLVSTDEIQDVWQLQGYSDPQCHTKNSDGQTVLHIAAEKGHKQICSILIAHGFDIGLKDYNNETPLSLACTARHLQTLRVMLSSLKETGKQQDNKVVMRAVQNGDTDVLQLLIEYGFGINFIDPELGVPLHVATQCGMREMVRFLLLNGADPEKEHDGHRPVHVVAAKGDIESLIMLIEFGANILGVSGTKKENIIHFATAKRHFDFVKSVFELPDSSKLINMKNSTGETALHVACTIGCPDLTKLLLEVGFNPKQPNKTGLIPEELADKGLKRSINSKNMKKWNAFADCMKTLQT